MNYVAQSRTPNVGALFGALAIPAGVGAALIIGLAVTVVVTKPVQNPDAINVEVDLPPPPPKPDTPEAPLPTPTQPTIAPDPVIPDTPFVISSAPTINTVPIGNLRDDLITLPLPGGAGEIAGPPFAPTRPDPVAAAPRGNPGSWIMERDYRPRWIREGLSGVAGFTLKIDTRGRVTDCTITRSTGHAVLDGATCRLLTRRARFDPARGPSGDAVPGTYSSSVAWEIP